MSTISSLSSSGTDYWQTILSASQSRQAGKKDDLASKLFNDLDTDGSGGISLEESGLDEEIYSGLDADQDGTVTLAELSNALELQRAAFMTQMAQGGQAGSQPPPPPPSGDGTEKPNAQDLLASIFGGLTSTEDDGTDSLSDYLEVSTDNDDLIWSAFSGSTEDTTAAESSEVASASASASGAGGGDSEEEYDEMDLNKDGIVSPEEYAIAMARHEAMMNPGGSGEAGLSGQRAKAANAYGAGAFFGTGASETLELSVTA